MTISAGTEEIGARLPSESDKVAANKLRRIIAAHADGGAMLRGLDVDRRSVDMSIPSALSQLLLELLGHIGRAMP
jgi:hypothetical protein